MADPEQHRRRGRRHPPLRRRNVQQRRHRLPGTRHPLGRLERPAWEAVDGDNWHPVTDLHEAAEKAESLTQPGDTLWITTGRTSLAAFESLQDRHLLVRCVDRPDPSPDFRNWTLIEARGPYELESERNLITQHNVAALVTKTPAARPPTPNSTPPAKPAFQWS